MILRKLKKEYYEDEKPMTEEEKDKLYKRALEAGLIGAGSGAVSAGTGLILGNAAKNPKNEEFRKRLGNSPGILKVAGASLAAPSLALAGYGAYKHYKHKKKDKEENKK